MGGYKPLELRQNYDAAMTFQEIAQVLGMKTSTVQLTYVVAMRKLRARSAEFGGVQDLISQRERTRCRPAMPGAFRARVKAIPAPRDAGTED